MRTSRLIMLVAALMCASVACKKDGSSLNKESENSGVLAPGDQTGITADFENATGLNVVDQQPFNPDSRLQFASVQEAAVYFNNLRNADPIPIGEPADVMSLPAPDDQQGCPDCKVVTFIGTMPFHFSVLTGRIYFKKDPYSPQYNYVNDTWHLYGAHMGMNSGTPIVISMNGYTKFNFTKLIEYYVGIRIAGFDLTVSWWYRVFGNGDVNNAFGAGFISPF